MAAVAQNYFSGIGIGNAECGGDSLYNIAITATKPVSDIFSTRGPFKIVNSTIGFVFVLMVNAVKSERVRDECLGDEAVNEKSFGANRISEFAFGVSSGLSEIKQSRTDVSAVRRDLTEATHPTDVADFVKPLVTYDWSPLFIRSWLEVVGRCAKNLSYKPINIERSCLLSLWAKIGNAISVQHRSLKFASRQLALDWCIASRPIAEANRHLASALPMIRRAGQTAYLTLIRNFVKALVARNSFPFLIHADFSCGSYAMPHIEQAGASVKLRKA